MGVDHGVANVLVTKRSLHQQDVAGLVIERAGFPVSQSLESNHAYSRIPESLRNISSSHVKPSCEMVELSGPEHARVTPGKLTQHSEQLRADLNLTGVGAFLGNDV